jgi:hypothetical protein
MTPPRTGGVPVGSITVLRPRPIRLRLRSATSCNASVGQNDIFFYRCPAFAAVKNYLETVHTCNCKILRFSSAVKTAAASVTANTEHMCLLFSRRKTVVIHCFEKSDVRRSRMTLFVCASAPTSAYKLLLQVQQRGCCKICNNPLLIKFTIKLYYLII